MTTSAGAGDGLAEHATALLATNRYLTLGTVRTDGRPWTTPVYFAPGPKWLFYWISRRDAVHSCNLAERPEVSLVIFDSTVTPHHGRALYADGDARELRGDEVEDGLQHYPGHSSRGVPTMGLQDVTGVSEYRLYAAAAAHVWVLCPRESGQPCPLHGHSYDHRAAIAG